MFARVDGAVSGACHALAVPCYWVGEGAEAAQASTLGSAGTQALTQLQAVLVVPEGMVVRVMPGERHVLVQLTDTAGGNAVLLETGVRVGEGLSPSGVLEERVRRQVQAQIAGQVRHLRLWTTR